MIKRVLAFCLALLMIWPLLTACGGGNRKLTIIDDGACNIVFDPETASSKTLNTLIAAIEEQTGVEVTSSRNGEITKGTILLGNVVMDDKGNRIAAELRNQDFTVGITGDYYLIGGITEENTSEAVDYFIENVLPTISDDGQKLKVSAKDNYTCTGTYRLEGLTIGGVSLGHFSIVIPDKASVSELRTAALLRQQISMMTGYEPTIVSDEEAVTEAQIRIGTSLCTKATATEAHSYAVAVSGKVMEIAAESYLGYQAVQDVLTNKVFHTKNTTLQMDDSLTYTGNGQENATEPLEKNGELRIMFNNIHGWDENGTMPVEQPTEMLTELYLEYLPDILGLQEYTTNSYNAGLPKLLEAEYKAAYADRTYTSIFYRTSTVECLKSGYLGFDSMTYDEYPELLGSYTGSQIKNNNKRQSDGTQVTSNGRVDGSKGVTWGIFRVKATGKLIMVGSTHLWWESNDDMDEIARKIQLKALREHLCEQAAAFATENGLSTPIPIVVGGDYNTSQRRSNTALSVMSQTGNSFTHANDMATVKLTTTTHHPYATYNQEIGIYDNPQYSGNNETYAIDHIYFSTASQPLVAVNTYGVINDLYAHLSSDHNPIYVDINFQNSAPVLSN